MAQKKSAPAEAGAGTPAAETFLVRATQTGYLGCLREPGGEPFAVTDEQFSDTWMERVEPAADAAA